MFSANPGARLDREQFKGALKFARAAMEPHELEAAFTALDTEGAQSVMVDAFCGWVAKRKDPGVGDQGEAKQKKR